MEASCAASEAGYSPPFLSPKVRTSNLSPNNQAACMSVAEPAVSFRTRHTNSRSCWSRCSSTFAQRAVVTPAMWSQITLQPDCFYACSMYCTVLYAASIVRVYLPIEFDKMCGQYALTATVHSCIRAAHSPAQHMSVFAGSQRQ